MSAKSKEYLEGVAAFRRGDDEDACPYPRMREGYFDRRVAWFNGYFDERTGTRLAKAFQYYGIQWP